MIKFNYDKIRVEYHKMLSCTSALNGSALVVKESKNKKKELHKKIPLTKEVVRQFIKLNKISKFIKPIPVSIAYYGNIAIAMEGHPMGMAGEIFSSEITEGLGKRWISTIESNLNRFLKPLTIVGDWYIDGKYVYTIPRNGIERAKPLSSDNKFRLVLANTIKLVHLSTSGNVFVDERHCIGYFLNDQKYSLSPPIWRTFDTEDQSDGHNDRSDLHFDFVDNYYRVNLHFALRAGRAISDLYGYDAIEPLNLADIMLKLKTVNLPSLDASTKATYPIKLNITHAMSWLLGLLYRKNTLETTVAIRGLLKCLTTNGVFHKNLMTETSIFKEGHTTDSVPLKTMDEAKDIDDRNLSIVLEQITSRRNSNDGSLNRVANLYASD